MAFTAVNHIEIYGEKKTWWRGGERDEYQKASFAIDNLY